MEHNQNTYWIRHKTNLFVIINTSTQLDLQQLICQVQLLTQTVLATQNQNQTLSPQQVLATMVTHMTPPLSLSASPSAHSSLHFPLELW